MPGGGLTTLARLELMRTGKITAVFCTPSYALHMAEVAAEHQIDVGELDVRQLVLAGEPGGSVPAIRERIEKAWKACVFDHAGATEVGPWGYGDLRGQGLYVNEHDFIAEFLSVETGTAGRRGRTGRAGAHQPGPHRQPDHPLSHRRPGAPQLAACRARTGLCFCHGGVLGRADDMMVIRGVNVFPSSVEQILRSFPEVIEYRMTARKSARWINWWSRSKTGWNDPCRWPNELRLAAGAEGRGAHRAAGHAAARRRQRQTFHRRAMQTRQQTR